MSDAGAAPGWADEAGLHRLTVLSVDIHGSTDLIQHLDPEAADAILGPAMRAMVEEVERHKGVAGHRGDGVMAIFGPPSVCEDHALRACLAAIGISTRLAALELPGLKARIGIHSGEAIVSRVRIGRSSLPQATGVAVHIAARLEQTAEPGTTSISESVLGLVRGFVQTRPLEAVAVKGVDEPVARHALLGVDPRADRWSVRAAVGLGPIVNRTAELAALRSMLTGAGGKTLRIVQIAGPAGIGKSRLLHEFLTAPATQSAVVIRFGGDQHRHHVPFHAIAGWLRDAMRVSFAADRQDALLQISTVAAEFAVDTPRTIRILERLLGLSTIAAPVSSAPDPADVADVIADIVAWQAGKRRVVLACEDVDHFDVASRDLLLALLDKLGDCDMLVVATSRAKTRLRTGRPVRMLNVAPLSRDQTVEMLSAMAPGFRQQPEMTAAVAARTGGNPLFVEEVASLVLRTGLAAEPAHDGPRVEDLGETFAGQEPLIPERVEALIADRLARMPRDLRQLVRLCAVIGPDVPVHLIATLSGAGLDGVLRQLERLHAAQILDQTRVYPDPQFSFRHALIRDVAYHALLASRRRELHGQIVAAIEAGLQDASDAQLDDLCYHALQARMWLPAFGYLRRAAAVAVRKFAYQIAYAHLSRALEISRQFPDTRERGDAQVAVGLEAAPLLVALGRYHDAARLLDETETIAAGLQDAERLILVMGWRCHVFNVLGELNQATTLGQRAFDAARSTDDVVLQQSAGHYLGQARFNVGDLKRADAVLAEVERLVAGPVPRAGSSAFGSPPVLISGTRTLTLALLGRFEDAALCVARAMKRAEATGKPYDSAFIRSVDGIRLLQCHDHEAAAATIEIGTSLAEEAGLTHLLVPLRIGLGHVHLLRGEYATAWAILSNSLEEARARHRHMMQIWCAAGLALTELRLGQPARAEESATEGLVVAERHGFRGFRVLAARALGLVLLQRPDRRAAARSTLEASWSLATALDMRPEIAHAHVGLARLGDGDAAHHRAMAEQHYRAMGMPVRLARIGAPSDARAESPAS